MLFSANIAVEQGDIVAVIVIALFIVTCRRSLTQRLVSWSSPVVSKVRIRTQRRVGKGQKMGRAEAIQTGVINFQLYPCLSACSIDTWEKSRLLTLKTNLATCCKNQPHFQYFFIRCLRYGSPGVHQTQIWVALKKVWEVSGWSLSLNPLVFN